MTRNVTLDLARTLAISLMVIFHFIYDLKFFGYVSYDIPDGQGWVQFRWLIISLFFLCLGCSLHFAHARGLRLKKFAIRLGQITFFALAISVVTYFAIPENWIFFGVLHFLAFASVVVLPFRNHPIVCTVIGILFFAIASAEIVHSRWPFHLLFDNLPAYTNDYVSLVPWLGMVFFGVAISHTSWFKNDPLSSWIKSENSAGLKALLWPGQHSLSIYVLHQPIMLGMLYLISLI